jgi:hypothetical protein
LLVSLPGLRGDGRILADPRARGTHNEALALPSLPAVTNYVVHGMRPFIIVARFAKEHVVGRLLLLRAPYRSICSLVPGLTVLTPQSHTPILALPRTVAELLQYRHDVRFRETVFWHDGDMAHCMGHCRVCYRYGEPESSLTACRN